MASSYTEGLVIELIGSGDKAGSWGDVTNSNLQALNQGVSGFSDIDLSSQSSPYSIDLLDAQAASESTSPSRSSVIRFYGHSDGFVVNFQINGTASTRINCIIVNGHASNSLVVGTGTGGTVTIPATYSARVHGDGSGLENSFANLSVTKLALGNQEVISNTVDDRVDITARVIQVGDGTGDAVIQSDGTGTANYDLVLRNNPTTNTSSIRINDEANGNIEITPHGDGKVVMDKVNIGGGEIDGTPIGANAASTGAFTSATVDDIVLDGKVITMTGSPSDTATFTVGTNGTLDIVTTDNGVGTAANIQITADGTAELAGTSVTLDASSNITLDANGGTITFADNGASLGTITSSGYSGTAATVTTNANLTGPVTSSGNATTIASGVVTGSNFNITSGSVSGDYLLAADGTGGGLKWVDQPTGDVTGVTAGTNLNGGGSEGAVTVNLDSAISLANVTTSSKIIVGADSDFTTGTAYIASQGGVRSSTYTSRTTNQAMSISPNGTGKLSLTSANTGIDSIDITSTAGGVHVDIGEYDDAVYFKVPNGIGESSAFQLLVTRTGPYLHENGGRYLNFSSGTGSGGFGLRGTNSYLEASNRPNDGWGQVYHAGMTSGQGAFFASLANLGSAVGSGGLTNNFAGTVTHGLVTTPKIIRCVIRCLTGQYNWVAGDEVDVTSLAQVDETAGGTVSETIAFGADTTNLYVACNRFDRMQIPNRNGGVGGSLTLANWDIYMYAWK